MVGAGAAKDDSLNPVINEGTLSSTLWNLASSVWPAWNSVKSANVTTLFKQCHSSWQTAGPHMAPQRTIRIH